MQWSQQMKRLFMVAVCLLICGAQNQADRLQFEEHFYLETRRFYRIAEENHAKAAKIQEEIDRLAAQRAELLKK
jgi:hypothetical protein